MLDGAKRWIGLASIADVAIIWAKTDERDPRVRRPDRDRGLHRDPDRAEAVDARVDPVRHHPDGVRLPADALLPGAHRPQGPVLLPQRGPLRDHVGRDGRRPRLLRDRAALRPGTPPVRQPIAAFQLTQQKLVDMVLEIQKGMLVALQTGRLKDAGTLRPEQISFGKLNNVREAIEICRSARTILGGNGITLEHSPLRHANNLESVRTYEGTDEVHTLIMGRASPACRPSGGRDGHET